MDMAFGVWSIHKKFPKLCTKFSENYSGNAIAKLDWKAQSGKYRVLSAKGLKGHYTEDDIQTANIWKVPHYHSSLECVDQNHEMPLHTNLNELWNLDKTKNTSCCEDTKQLFLSYIDSRSVIYQPLWRRRAISQA